MTIKLAKSILKSNTKDSILKAISVLQKLPSDPSEKQIQILFLIKILMQYTNNLVEAEMMCQKALESGADRAVVLNIQLEIWLRLKKYQFGLKMIDLAPQLDSKLQLFKVKYLIEIQDWTKLKNILKTELEEEENGTSSDDGDQRVSSPKALESSGGSIEKNSMKFNILFQMALGAIKFNQHELLRMVLERYQKQRLQKVDGILQTQLDMIMILFLVGQGQDCNEILESLQTKLANVNVKDESYKSFVFVTFPQIMAYLVFGMAKKGSDMVKSKIFFEQGIKLVKMEMEKSPQLSLYQKMKREYHLMVMLIYLELNVVELLLAQRKIKLATSVTNTHNRL